MKFVRSIIKNSEIIKMFGIRDIQDKYRGSYIGVTWTIINPAIMLTIYTIVFSQIFRVRWGSIDNADNPTIFAINLFAGLIVFNIFAESAGRGPTLITSNPNYVKKVRFPIEVLGITTTLTAVVNACISIILLIIFQLLTTNTACMTLIILPVIWTPLILGVLGFTWLLSTVGVFVKDINQINSSLISMAMFMSPVFYPKSAFPDNLKLLLTLNPLANIIEQTRMVVIENKVPNIDVMIINILVSIIWCEIMYRVMKSSQRSMGDQL